MHNSLEIVKLTQTVLAEVIITSPPHQHPLSTSHSPSVKLIPYVPKSTMDSTREVSEDPTVVAEPILKQPTRAISGHNILQNFARRF